MKTLKTIRKEELAQIKFEKAQIVDNDHDLNVYKLDYYENEVHEIEWLHLGELMVGSVKVKR
jgi:hypothetical protein